MIKVVEAQGTCKRACKLDVFVPRSRDDVGEIEVEEVSRADDGFSIDVSNDGLKVNQHREL